MGAGQLPDGIAYDPGDARAFVSNKHDHVGDRARSGDTDGPGAG